LLHSFSKSSNIKENERSKVMKKLNHLTQEERDIISILHAKLFGVRKIAREISRSPATISRELNRKEAVYFKGDYIGSQTHKQVKVIWAKSHNRKKLTDAEVREYVIRGLQHRWSPETIAGRLRMKFNIKISYSTIYRFIRSDRKDLRQYLLRQNFKRKTTKTKAMRSLVPDRIDISKRPKEANERLKFGHFEGDTVLSSRESKHALVVIADRASRKTHIKRLFNKRAIETNPKIISILEKYPKKYRKSITFDNGPEFFGHKKIAKELKIKTYFCKPYSAWQKGTVENINGLIRRFFPKKTDFDFVSDAELQFVEDWINNRPMKVLNFKTPNERYQELTGVAIA
jgi:transposase, IS30 family